MADGTTFPPFQTIPDLTPAGPLLFTDQVWINRAGADLRANLGDVAALAPPSVTAFNGRVGPVNLTIADITGAGGAPNSSPVLVGVPQAPTAAFGSSTAQIATTAFVAAALSGTVAGVSAFNGRTGSVIMGLGDVVNAGGAPLINPNLQGTPTAPTAAFGTNSTQLATTAFVASAVAAMSPGVSSFNNRTGPVQLTLADVTGIGGAPNTSPILTGVPQAPTPARGSNTPQIATTAFVQDAISSEVAGVSSFNARQGAVTLTGADITGAGGALLASPIFTGAPQGPTAAPGTSTTQFATTAFVGAALGGVGTVSSVGLAMPSIFTVTNSPITTFGSLTVAFNNQPQGLVLASPAGATGQPTFRALTASDIPSLSGLYLPLAGGTVTGPLTVNGAIAGGSTLQINGAITSGQTSSAAGGNLNLVAPAGNNRGVGIYSDSAERWLIYANFTAEGGANSGSDFRIGRYSDAGTFIDAPVQISRATGIVTLDDLQIAAQKPAGTVLAAPAGAAGQPSFRALTAADISGGVGVTSVGLVMPSMFGVVGSPVTGAGNLTVAYNAQAASTVLAAPAAGGQPTFRALTAADLPALSYLPLAGGTLTGPLNVYNAGALTSLVVSKNVTQPPPASTLTGNTLAQFTPVDGTPGRVLIDGCANNAILDFRRINGTAAAPTAVVGANFLGIISASGYDGTAYTNPQAQLRFSASENWNATSHGAELQFLTTPITTLNALQVGGFYNNGGFWVSRNVTQPAPALPAAGDILAEFTGRDGTAGRVLLDGFGGGSQARLSLRAALGTAAAPLAVAAAGSAGNIETWGYDGSAFGIAQTIAFNFSEAWSPTAHGAEINFQTTKAGTTATTRTAGVTNDGSSWTGSATAQLAAAATGGFQCIPTIAGPPTGVPALTVVGAPLVGQAPTVFDPNTGLLWLWNGTAWVNPGAMGARIAWTPLITFATPGDLAVAYTTQVAWYVKNGAQVVFSVALTFTPTYTTAAGALRVSGLPVAAIFGNNMQWVFPLLVNLAATWPTGATQAVARIQGNNGNIFDFEGVGSGVAAANFTTANFPSGALASFSFSGSYTT